jgi:signal transduction histidine kinase/DNA-binding response OmpR family regulator
MADETILIVDDDIRNVEFLRDSLLVPSGYATLCATNGEEALRLALTEDPDLILLDLQIPKLDGFEVLEGLKKEGGEIPTILMTAHGSESVAVQAFRLGVKDYFPKPFKVTEIMEAVERALTEARLRKEKRQLAAQVGAINRQLEQRVKELEILYGISKSVASLLDLDTLLTRVVEATTYVTGADEISLFLLDADTEELLLRAVQGVGDQQARQVNRKADNAVVRQVMGTGQVAMIQSPRSHKTDPLQATLAVPLKTRDGTIGVLSANNNAALRPFSNDDRFLLSVLADFAAVAIENAKLFAEVEEQRSKLETILAGSQDLIVVADEEAGVLLMNPAAADAFCLEPQEATGRPLHDVIGVEAFNKLFRGPAAGNGTRNVELPLIDGRIFHTSLSPVADVGCVLIMRDITHLRELDRMKSDFVASITHDLRSPLTAIHGSLRLLPQLGRLNEEQEEFAQRAMRNVEQMDKLISSLLDIGRIEAGLEMEMGSVRLEEVVEEVVANLQGEAKTKELALDTAIADNLSSVRGNHTRLVQVMSNLLDNAIRYTPPGGRVVVSAGDDGDEVWVSVSDTGVGIPAHAKKHIFDKFYRVEGPGTLGSEGMGLGLATVKSIVEKHGGRVWVKSKEGEGSTFHFVLPKMQADSPEG